MKIDLKNGFHLLRICKGDEWLTAFKMPEGLYKYLVAPFGSCETPGIFQLFTYQSLKQGDPKRHVKKNKWEVYSDDILIV